MDESSTSESIAEATASGSHSTANGRDSAVSISPLRPFGVKDFFANLFFWPSLFIAGAFIGIFVFGLFPITFFVDPKRKFNMFMACLWSWLCVALLRLTGLWTIEYRGMNAIPKNFCGVITPNHLSQFDILILHASLLKAKWVSKSSVFWIPFFGWAMWTMKYVSLKRNEQKSIREMTRTCAASLQSGIPLVVFPEGTRSRTGALQPFKNGAFLIAKLAKAPVLPVAITGTYDALPPGKMFLRAGIRIVVEYLPPIDAEVTSNSSPGDVSAVAHAAIHAAVERNRQR